MGDLVLIEPSHRQLLAKAQAEQGLFDAQKARDAGDVEGDLLHTRLATAKFELLAALRLTEMKRRG